MVKKELIKLNLKKFLDENIVGNDKYLHNKINSDQFDLSVQIIKLEKILKLNQRESAKILNISFDRLLELESGDAKIQTKYYVEAIDRLEDIAQQNVELSN